jgi:hypothetical protein
VDDAPPTRRAGPTRAWLVLFAAACAACAAAPVANAARHPAANKDYSLWFEVGLRARAGEPLYPDDPRAEFPYLYPPPLAACVLAPLTRLGPVGFVVALAAANAAAWLTALLLSARLATGRGDCHTLVYVLPAVATAPYVWDTFLLGQVNLVLLALVLGSLLALRHGRPWLAGLGLGAAVAAKAFPLPVVVYFAARRRWAAVASTLLSAAIVLVLLPAPTRGLERNFRELGVWARGMLADQSGGSVAQRSSIGFTRRNQSLESVAHRLLRPVDAGDRDGAPFRVNVADVGPAAARAVGFGGCLALGLVLLAATRCRFAPGPRAEGQEAGMVLALAVLCSPLAWTYFFCWLMPAWAAAAAHLAGRPRGWAAAGFALAGALAASAASELYDPLVPAYGATAWAGVVLFLTLALVRRREPGAGPAREPPRPGPGRCHRRVGRGRQTRATLGRSCRPN